MIAQSMPSYAGAVQAILVLGIIVAVIGTLISCALVKEHHLGRLGRAICVAGVLAAVVLAGGVVMLWYHADWVAFERSCRIEGSFGDCVVFRR